LVGLIIGIPGGLLIHPFAFIKLFVVQGSGIESDSVLLFVCNAACQMVNSINQPEG
jgi:hypothetical protein